MHHTCTKHTQASTKFTWQWHAHMVCIRTYLNELLGVEGAMEISAHRVQVRKQYLTCVRVCVRCMYVCTHTCTCMHTRTHTRKYMWI